MTVHLHFPEPENVCTTAPTSNEFEVSKSLSTLFSCSGGGTFNFSPSGNVVINGS